MLWGVAPESWAQLWSGVIGSFVAAVIGGLVALGVVRLTNRHLSRQAAEQRVMAKAQHRKDAMIDFISAINSLADLHTEGFEVIREMQIRAEHAAVRWGMDIDSLHLKLEIAHWPRHIGYLARRAFRGRERASNDADALRKDLYEAAQQLAFFGPALSTFDAASKRMVAEGLREGRTRVRPDDGWGDFVPW